MYVKRNIKEEAEYLVTYKCTIRQVAEVFNVSKSAVFLDLTRGLKNDDSELYREVRKVLDRNKAERHIRGGLATKRKYENLKKCITV